MTPDGQNVINSDVFDPNRVETTRNVISRSLQERLRKKKVDLPKSEIFLCDFSRGQMDRERGEKKNPQTEVEKVEREGGVIDGDGPQGEAKITECDDAGILRFTEPVEAVTECSSEAERGVVTTGVVTDEDLIKLRAIEKKTVIAIYMCACVYIHVQHHLHTSLEHNSMK